MTTREPPAQGWVDPLHHPVAVASIPAGGLEIRDELDFDARERLARALELDKVERLSATYRLTPRSGGIIVVSGEIRADVRPVCVVTLEPFDLAIREPVEMRFAEPQDERRRPRLDEEDIGASDDPPDEIENGVIDLGRVTTEFLSLAIPMYPRKPGIAFDEAPEPARASPFADLAALKDTKDRKG